MISAQNCRHLILFGFIINKAQSTQVRNQSDDEHSRAILDSAIKGNVNGNQMKQKGKKWPWENLQFKDKDRVFFGQDLIHGK